MSERSKQVVKYCTHCGTRIGQDDAFCGNCGTRRSRATPNTAATQEILTKRSEKSPSIVWSRLRSSFAGQDVLLGISLALASSVLIVGMIYALLTVRGAFSDPAVPKAAGLALFALLHGGAASVDIPPTPALLGLGGSVRLGLPVTSFALLPFVVSLLLSRTLAGRVRMPGVFIGVSAIVYALVVAALAAFGAAPVGTEELTAEFTPDSVSTALRGCLLVGLGTMIGAAAVRGPLLPERVRQVIRGSLLAVGVSLVGVLVLTGVVVAFEVLQQGSGAPTQPSPEGLARPALEDLPVREGLAGIGAIFTLLPIGLGNLWLLAHGVPVGVQNAPDLSGIPMVGEALAGVPLRVSLVGEWPWGSAWRLLLVAPVAGLLLGGRVSARGADPSNRWQWGALVALPYTVIALLIAIVVGVSADVSVAGASFEGALRASLVWLLILLPIGVALGAAGGLLSRESALPLPRPQRTFLIASVVGVIVLLASLPVATIGSSSGSTPTVGSGSSDEEAAVEQPAPEPPPQAEVSDDAPDTSRSGDDVSTSTQSIASDAPPDPAFDPLLPVLEQRTSAPIMLPAKLPDELENVAVDADQSGDRYGIVFLYRPTSNLTESYVHANDVGTLTVAPEPEDTASEYFESTSEETVKLPDGTEADLRYMEPTVTGSNAAPFWQGQYEREGHTYTLNIPLADPSGDVARHTLTSMVEVKGGTSSPDSVTTEAAVVEATEDYYQAVDRQDWDYTYSNLDSQSQTLFSETEWALKNQWYADREGLFLNTIDVQVNDSPAEGKASVTVNRSFTSGLTNSRDTYFVLEDGTWKHRLTDEEQQIFLQGTSYEEFVAAKQ